MECKICSSSNLESVMIFNSKPESEVSFVKDLKSYKREIFRCNDCNHFMNIHDMLEDDAYDSDYNEAHYGSKNDIKKTFERIINLKPSESDNYHRVQRVLECVEDLN